MNKFMLIRIVNTEYLQELASHSPFGLNFTDDTAFVCPARVNLRVQFGFCKPTTKLAPNRTCSDNLKLHKHVPPATLTQSNAILTVVAYLPPLKTCSTVELFVITNLDQKDQSMDHHEFDVQQDGLVRDLAAPCFNFRRTTIKFVCHPTHSLIHTER